MSSRTELLRIAKPILFNTEMVRAILNGRKKVTRRVVKCPEYEAYDAACAHRKWLETYNPADMPKHLIDWYVNETAEPPYKPDSILYVRETWQYLYELDGNDQIIENTGRYYYAATDDVPFSHYIDSEGIRRDHVPWRPSIHMPKEAARIFLRVKDVRVERLQDIDANGIRQEGLTSAAVHSGDMEIALDEWRILWNSTIKKADRERYGWAANPWVFVIEFERVVPDD